jgi:hypothetical protein
MCERLQAGVPSFLKIFRREIIFSLVPVRFLGALFSEVRFKVLKPAFECEFLSTVLVLFERKKMSDFIWGGNSFENKIKTKFDVSDCNLNMLLSLF